MFRKLLKVILLEGGSKNNVQKREIFHPCFDLRNVV